MTELVKLPTAGPSAYLSLIELASVDAAPELYLLPITFASGSNARRLAQHSL